MSGATAGGGPALIEVEGLTKRFELRDPGLFGRSLGAVHALTDVDLRIERGETLAVVGESGCGKSTLAKCLAQLHTPTAGAIRFEGEDIFRAPVAARKAIRRRVQMVFQDPFGSLNPRMTAAEIIAEPLLIHRIGDAAERNERTAETASRVGLRSGDLGRYPHEFSGGQRQRIAIARAAILEPDLIIADEPLSALDVSVQSQILNLFMELGRQSGLTYVFISHDLGAVRHIADRIAVLYSGRVVEAGPAETLFAGSRHPYTQSLMEAVPRPGAGKRLQWKTLGGDPPSAIDPPGGCAFHPRCPIVQDICRRERPDPAVQPDSGPGHASACHFAAGPEQAGA